ncbi:hypothetical protein [Nostoc sp.]|uniref:hypothetical protein n=1 Tax=Nostoc sp. TaxID=1180 RepID=UPI002FF7BBD0
MSISARIDSRDGASVGVLVVGLPSAALIASNKKTLAVILRSLELVVELTLHQTDFSVCPAKKPNRKERHYSEFPIGSEWYINH